MFGAAVTAAMTLKILRLSSEPAVHSRNAQIYPTYLDGDQARGEGVERRPVMGETHEVLLGDHVLLARRRRVESIEDDSDKQVHEDVRDGQREAFTRIA